MRPLVTADLAAAYNSIAPSAVAAINSGRDLKPLVFFMTMSESTPGTISEIHVLDPLIVHMLGLIGEPGIDALADIIRKALKVAPDGKRPPDIAVQVCEGWVAEVTEENKGIEPRHCPNKREAIVILEHVCNHTYVQNLYIDSTNGGARHVELSPFVAPEDSGVQVISGRVAMHEEDQ
jgi:hypothetical protein